MTDVIRGQQKSTGTIWVFAPDCTDQSDAAKHQFNQQFAGVVKDCFHFAVGVFRIPFQIENFFFKLIDFLNVILFRWFQFTSRSESMKPRSPSTGGKGRFPQTDFFFHSGFGQWRGSFWSSDGEDRSRFRNLVNLGREYRLEAARERAREMAAFAVIVLTSAWPVVYMIVTVVKLLSKARPLN